MVWLEGRCSPPISMPTVPIRPVPVAQMLGNVVNQVRGCGFTVGTRNAYQGKFLGGFAVESGCHARLALRESFTTTSVISVASAK